jgi:2-polyprenyl-3-methyl-5-hydroxy-6-metoxy-1,4-benzoquinol methylase
MSLPAPAPNPLRFFEAVSAYQQTEAIKAAVELELFTAIAETGGELQAIAARCRAAPRGVRILCDFLAIQGFLTKAKERYELTPDSRVFLVRTSPAYLGGSLEFLLSSELIDGFRSLTDAVRRGGTVLSREGTMEEQHPVWVKFARVMGPVTAVSAPHLVELADPQANRPLRVLDLAAGHGFFGIALARRNPYAQVVAQDWGPVLQVAREHAQGAGVVDRYSVLAGSAFDVDLGSGYDVILVTNFLHHFDVSTCEQLIRRLGAALKPGGIAVTLEFIPNDDRITPPPVARFSATMLATTAAGDAYTFREYESMFRNAGFTSSTLHALPDGPQSAVVSTK